MPLAERFPVEHPRTNCGRSCELQRLQFSRAKRGVFGTFWEAATSAVTTRKPLNHAEFLRFPASRGLPAGVVQIPSG